MVTHVFAVRQSVDDDIVVHSNDLPKLFSELFKQNQALLYLIHFHNLILEVYVVIHFFTVLALQVFPAFIVEIGVLEIMSDSGQVQRWNIFNFSDYDWRKLAHWTCHCKPFARFTF